VMQIVGQTSSKELLVGYTDLNASERYACADQDAVFKAHFLGHDPIDKIHQGKIRNVCTLRHPFDCVASRQKFKDEEFEESLELVRLSWQQVKWYGEPSTLFVRYDDIMASPAEQIAQIALYLERPIALEQIRSIEANTTLPAMDRLSRYTQGDEADPITQLHRNHCHGGTVDRWKTELTPAQIMACKEQLSDSAAIYEDHSNHRCLLDR